MTAASPARVRVVHLITDLDIGGAEIMLTRLVGTLAESPLVENVVISLTSGGRLRDEIAASGVKLLDLGLKPGWRGILAWPRAVRILRPLRPHILQTWLYHADLAGLVLSALTRVPILIWNVRCAALDPADHHRLLPALLRLLAAASARPAAVISNSEAGRRAHEQLGYRPRRWEIIPNGFDAERFAPDARARRDVRAALGVADDMLLVGLIGRYHPMKDHSTFVEAAALVAQQHRRVTFVMAGRGVMESVELAGHIAARDLTDRVILLQEQDAPARLFAALDVAVSSSYSEAFPNVVGEAMACGTAVVVTDAGDSARLVGSSGSVVPTRDPRRLADAISDLVTATPERRDQLGAAARARIIEHYSLSAVARAYERLYTDLAAEAGIQGVGCVA